MKTGKKPPRARTSSENETNVLVKSARRCLFCFRSAKGRLKEKAGQIAHLDRNPSNGKEDNLAWMCLLHHTKYDSRNSQHKNYTAAEAKELRRQLYEAIALGEHWEDGSQPLKKSLSEIMDFLGDTDELPPLKPDTLRLFLHDKIGDLAERWFRRGFNRGHVESYKAFLDEEAVPKRLKRKCRRTFSPARTRSLTLQSTVKEFSATTTKKRP